MIILKGEMGITNMEKIDAWINYREECIESVKNLHVNALKKYLDKVGIKDVFAYEYNYGENKFTIYTRKPGVWIGKGGQGVTLLKQILSEEVKENCDVCFKEIKGYFVSHQ